MSEFEPTIPCPECGSTQTRPRTPSDDVLIIDCVGCRGATTTLFDADVDASVVREAVSLLYSAREDRPRGRSVNSEYCAVGPVKEACDLLMGQMNDAE